MILRLGERSAFIPGEVFYYRFRGKIYGALSLFRQGDYRLIAISEEMQAAPQHITVEAVLDAPLYTLGWFSDADMLSENRIHRIGVVTIRGDYTNSAGLIIGSDGSIVLKNSGQFATWRHDFRAFALPGATVRDALDMRHIPNTTP